MEIIDIDHPMHREEVEIHVCQDVPFMWGMPSPFDCGDIAHGVFVEQSIGYDMMYIFVLTHTQIGYDMMYVCE